MEDKREQLKLTRSRWKILKERIGKNIIKSFQTTYLNVEEDLKNHLKNKMSEEEQIEEILEEANA